MKTVGKPISNRYKIIISTIEKNPGIRFRELLRNTKIPSGTLTYYIKKLRDENFINVEKTPGTCKFFSYEIKEVEKRIISVLRRKNLRDIILVLLDAEVLSLNLLASELKKSTSTISVNLKELREIGMIDFVFENKKKKFLIKNKKEVSILVKKFLPIVMTNR